MPGAPEGDQLLLSVLAPTAVAGTHTIDDMHLQELRRVVTDLGQSVALVAAAHRGESRVTLVLMCNGKFAVVGGGALFVATSPSNHAIFLSLAANLAALLSASLARFASISASFVASLAATSASFAASLAATSASFAAIARLSLSISACITRAAASPGTADPLAS